MMEVDDEMTEELWRGLEGAITRGDGPSVQRMIETMPGVQLTKAISRLPGPVRQKLVHILRLQEFSHLLKKTDPVVTAPLLALLEPEKAGAVMGRVGEEARSAMLDKLSHRDTSILLSSLSSEERDTLQQRLAFPKGSAGSLLFKRYVSHTIEATAGDVIDELRRNARKYTDYEVQYVYVLSASGRLEGVLRLRDLVFSAPESRVGSTMIPHPVTCSPHTALEDLIALFDDNSFFALPVVDEHSVMLGLVSRKEVERTAKARASSMMLRLHGIVGGEEYRSMSLVSRSLRRLSWLTANIALNLLAAGVIIFYENTLIRVISLAAFLPIISDMSGNAGNQAVAVSLRELTLRLIRPVEYGYVLLKEVSVGVINGVILGILIGLLAWAWKGNFWLGLVAGGALAINTILAVSVGGLLPLVLRRFRVDPALVAGPVLTTVTDVSGFLLALGFATLALDWLV